MLIVISLVLAFIFLGISEVLNDLGGSVIDRPMWANQPTLGMSVLVALTWFYKPFIYSKHSRGRTIAFGLLDVIMKLSIVASFIWCCIAISIHFFESVILEILVSALLIGIGSFIVLPLISLLMIPVSLIAAWPLDLMFPLEDHSKEIRWCRNCRQYKKSKEYEEIMHGLWRSESMPRSDKLPCKIVLEISDTWKHHFENEPRSRGLFPKDCPSFEKRA